MRGQVAMEFMLLAAFFLLVFTVILAYFASLQAREFEDREYAIGREVAARVADEVHAAVAAGNGYQKSFVLPDRIAGRYPYEVRINNKSAFAVAYVEINWSAGARQYEYAIPLASRNICTGNPAVNPPHCAQPIYESTLGSFELKMTDFSKAINVNNTGERLNVWQN